MSKIKSAHRGLLTAEEHSATGPCRASLDASGRQEEASEYLRRRLKLSNRCMTH